MLLFIIAIVVFTMYLLCSLRYIGEVPPSLSDTYYMIGKAKWCFTGMMWTVGFTMLPVILELTPPMWETLPFIALAGIVFVGGAPNFKDMDVTKTHEIAAIISAVFGLLWAIVVTRCAWWLIISIFWCLAVAIASGTLRRCKIFWLEMMAFSTVFLSTFILLIR